MNETQPITGAKATTDNNSSSELSLDLTQYLQVILSIAEEQADGSKDSKKDGN